MAADIRVKGLPLQSAPPDRHGPGHEGGVGLYTQFVHIDVGPVRHWLVSAWGVAGFLASPAIFSPSRFGLRRSVRRRTGHLHRFAEILASSAGATPF